MHLLGAVALVLSGALQGSREPVDFARDVKPILDAHCISCHGPKKHKGDYRVDTYEAAIEGSPGGKSILPGSPGGSDFFRRLVSDDAEYRMPQKEGRLGTREIEMFRRWYPKFRRQSQPAESEKQAA